MKAAKKMAAKPAGRGLGKGLSALMSESYSQIVIEETPSKIPQGGQVLPLTKIHAGKYQPRDRFDEEAMGELSDSIRKNGVMQPILVRPVTGGNYEIIAGERRFRAAKMAGLNVIPALIREIGDEQALELALVENIQREDLGPLEESAGYQRLMDEFGYTQEELSGAVQKSRSHVANLLRLLSLPEEVKQLLAENKISMGHARALTGAQNASALAQEIVKRGLNVRQIEKLVKEGKGTRKPRAKKAASAATLAVMHSDGRKDPDIMALEETLSENLGLKVSINDRGQAGEIMIAYESLEQLDEILRRLGGSI